MSNAKNTKISKTMTFLLRHRPELGDLKPDKDGWVAIADLSRALSANLSIPIDEERVVGIVRKSKVKHFEISGEKIRPVSRRGKRSSNRVTPPDILYYPCTAELMNELRSSERLLPTTGRQLHLCTNESDAWRLAHRLEASPRVLYIDAARASRYGTRFFRHQQSGHYLTHRVHVRDILNLLPRFAHQYSAGGIPVRWDEDQPMVLLCQVKRRSGITWEVAKGKLEPFETPEYTAVREVQEEMGFSLPMRPTLHVGNIRYGFVAPGGLPRLKTVYMYLLEATEPWDNIRFEPAGSEGIVDVRWFTAREGSEVVTHSSLIPVMGHVRDILDRQRRAILEKQRIDGHEGKE
jgi:putative RNA 2'-phosphotransferase